MSTNYMPATFMWSGDALKRRDGHVRRMAMIRARYFAGRISWNEMGEQFREEYARLWDSIPESVRPTPIERWLDSWG